MKFTRTTVDVHIPFPPSGTSYKLRLPGYGFVLPGTHLSLVVHKEVTRQYTACRPAVSATNWAVTEPLTGKRLMGHPDVPCKVRMDAVDRAQMVAVSKGMGRIAQAIMEFAPGLMGLEVRGLDGTVLVAPAGEEEERHELVQ